MKYVPNVISTIRFFMAIAMFFLRNNSVAFLILFFLCGFSDVLDGYLARKYHVESDLGAKIDGVGDTTFILSSLVSVLLIIPLKPLWAQPIYRFLVYWIVFLVLHKTCNACITRVKFGQFNGIHTIANKVAGNILFFTIPISVITKNFPAPWLLFCAGLIQLCFIEEMIMLFKFKEYKVDRKSLFIKEKDA